MSATPEDLSVAIVPARAREPEALEMARQVDPTKKTARILCLIALMHPDRDLYETPHGTTAAALAEVWGLGKPTVVNDACEASRLATLMLDPSAAASTFWVAASEQLSAALSHLAKIREMVDSVPVETALDVKMVSDALGRCSDSVDKAATTFGRAAGVIQQGSSTTVNVGIMLDAKGQPRPELAALRDGIGRAAAQMDPESARILRDEIASVGESLASARPVVTILADAVTVDDDDVAAVEAHPNEWVNCARSLFPGEDMATIRENVAAMLDALDAEMGEVEQ